MQMPSGGGVHSIIFAPPPPVHIPAAVDTCLEGAESATERGAIRQSWPDGPVSAARWLAFGNAVEDAQSEPERREAWELRPWARARLKNACNAPLVLNQYVGTFGGL